MIKPITAQHMAAAIYRYNVNANEQGKVAAKRPVSTAFVDPILKKQCCEITISAEALELAKAMVQSSIEKE